MEKETKTILLVVGIVAGVILLGMASVVGMVVLGYMKARSVAALSTTPVNIQMVDTAELDPVPTQFPSMECRIRFGAGWRHDTRTLDNGEIGEFGAVQGASVGIFKKDRHFMDFSTYVRSHILDLKKSFPDMVIERQGPTIINGLEGYAIVMHRTGKLGEGMRQDYILLQSSGTTVYSVITTAFDSGGTKAQELVESSASTFETGTWPAVGAGQ